MSEAVAQRIFILGEAWGENEARVQHALVGASGIALLQMMDEAGLITLTSEDQAFIRRFWETRDPNMVKMIWNLHEEFYTTNVFNFRPPGNDITWVCHDDNKEGKRNGIRGYPALVRGKFCKSEYQSELDRLREELFSVDPNIVIALGNTACWALLGQTAITKIRGVTKMSTHCVAGFKVLPILHPAAILREWSQRPVTVIDLIKAKRESVSPDVIRPVCEIWIEPEINDILEFKHRFLDGAERISVDIETSGTQITMVGIAPSRRLGIVIPFVDPKGRNRSYWPTYEIELQAWKILQGILEDGRIEKVFQNGLYDIAFIWRTTGIKVIGANEDTMLLHHALQPESLKGLGFLGSVYTDHGSWKQMREKVETIKKDD